MSRVLALVAPATIAVALAACGGSGDVKVLPRSERDALHAQSAQIRAAAADHDPETARAVLAALRARVATLARSGDLSDTQRTAILVAVADVDAAISSVPTTTTTLPPPPQVEEHGKGHGKGKKGED